MKIELKDIAENSAFENVFSTPIFSHIHKDAGPLNAQLRDLILEREGSGPNVSRSNRGGWQSPPDFFEWNSPSVTALQHYVSQAINIATLRVTMNPNLRFRTELYGWAAVNRKGDYNATHVHPMATWSGVYYVDPGDDKSEAGGLLEFVHPVAASVMTFFPNVLPSARVVAPLSGMVILFPSYLQHGVQIYRGERPRICVPFNAHLQALG